MKIKAEQTEIVNAIRLRSQVSPPSEGMFYVDNDLNTISVPRTPQISNGHRDVLDATNSPVVVDKYPVFVYTSDLVFAQTERVSIG